MNVKQIKTLLVILFFGTSFTLTQAQSDPFSNTLAASAEEDGTYVNNATDEDLIVPIVNAQEIRLLKKDQPYNTILLDMRTVEEFKEFRISEARWVGNDETNETIWYLDRNSTIVVYGNPDSETVDFSRRLKKMGFTDVRSYDGSIIDWINEGNHVVNPKGHIVKNVKFSDRKLNKLLK